MRIKKSSTVKDMDDNFTEIKSLLGKYSTQKILVEQVVKFARDEGILDIASSLNNFSFNKIKNVTQLELGYKFEDKIRERMLKVLVDILHECNLLKYNGKSYTWITNTFEINETEKKENINILFNDQIYFFERCLAYANNFFTGGSPLYKFNYESMEIWERFLSNIEFKFARSVLIKLLLVEKKDDCAILDLCCGPGFGLFQLKEEFPHIRNVTVLDFNDIFYESIAQKLNRELNVEFTNASLWKGFGKPLPFGDNSFDAILFSCADSYIPEKNREYVYKDIFRILKHKGRLGILTRSYPDVKREYVKNPWVRRGNLCHDFLESICDGWQGFYDADKSIQMYKKNNFDVEAILFNASVWILDKP